MVDALPFVPSPGPVHLAGPDALPGARWLALAADALATPLFIVQADATLVHANTAARAELERADALILVPPGRLVPARAELTAVFKAALAACAAGQARLLPGLALGVHAALSPLPMPAPTTNPMPPRAPAVPRPVSAHPATGVMPTPNEPLLLLSLPARGHRDLKLYAELHGLSVAECRVLERLALGDTTTEVSYVLGVKPATVRSQILNLRRKTGHADVAALLRDLAMMPPLARGGASPVPR